MYNYKFILQTWSLIFLCLKNLIIKGLSGFFQSIA